MLPKPHNDESMNVFMDRCMGADMMSEDYPEKDQRAAVCNKQWESMRKANSSMERKSFRGVQFKADKPGSFTARIATLNCIDSDGDVTLPGAFEQGKSVLVS